MTFEDDFDELDRLLSEKSTDYETMRSKLQAIRRLEELARMMSPAQDRLYASIARGHRKVFKHLEAGDIPTATRETAKAVAWFYTRFQGSNSETMITRCPQIADELREVREIAARSEILRDAISRTAGQQELSCMRPNHPAPNPAIAMELGNSQLNPSTEPQRSVPRP